MIRPALGALASLALAACEAPVGGASPGSPAHVELAGCAAVRRSPGGPVCEVTPERRTLRLWIEGEGELPVVRWRNLPLSPSSSRVGGGRQLVVELPAESAERTAGAGGALEVIDPASGRAALRLRTEAAIAPPQLREADARRREGKLREAREAIADPGSLPEDLRGRAAGLQARIDLAEGRTDEALAGLRRSIALHERDGRVSDEATDRFALAFTLSSIGRRYEEALAVLDGAAPALALWDEGRAQIGHYRSVVDHDRGDLRAALADASAAEIAGERLGLAEIGRSARQMRALALQALGRSDEAVALLDPLLAAPLAGESPCRRAELLANRGWVELAAVDARDGAVPTPALLSILEQTVTVRRASCPRPAQLQNAEVNLALGELLAGDVDGASAGIAAARAAEPIAFASVSAWLLELDARVASARGRPRDALRAYEELASRARAGYAPETEWQAAAGRGRALAALGDRPGAIAAYREAEALLDRRGALVPLGAGRASFLGDRERSARELTSLLAQAGRAAEALAVARTARSRALAAAERPDRIAGLDAPARARWDEAIARYQTERDALDRAGEDDWKLSVDHLDAVRAERRARRDRADAALDEALAVLAERSGSPPAAPPLGDGELLLAFFPAPGGKSWLFTADRDGADARLVAEPGSAPPEALSAALLAPIEARLDRARRLRVLPYGAWSAVDVHALPLHGEPLVARLAVEYALDLPPLAARRAPTGRALVVADSRRDLPEALREADRVEQRLGGSFQIDALRGRAAARSAILDRLAEAELFHFAGHGVFAGPTGWESGLLLGEGARLTIGDVLALGRAPAHVVLSGCETARAREGARGADLSLAHAFLAAGAEVVVAASRPIDDRLAAALASSLYEDASPGAWDAAEALRRAELAVRRTMPDGDWSAYRAIAR